MLVSHGKKGKWVKDKRGRRGAGVAATTTVQWGSNMLVAALFPVLIAVLVPVRLKVLPRIFGAENVDLMDAVGEALPPPRARRRRGRLSGGGAIRCTRRV